MFEAQYDQNSAQEHEAIQAIKSWGLNRIHDLFIVVAYAIFFHFVAVAMFLLTKPASTFETDLKYSDKSGEHKGNKGA